MLNPFLNASNIPKSENDLYQNLVDEAIQIKGMNVHYLIRNMENRDFLFGESSISSFKEKAEIEMYLAELNQSNGDGNIMGPFGMMMTDSAVFEVSERRFKQEFSTQHKLDRPREGDLIYMSMDDSLWEIKKVKSDSKYHQLGKNYKYRLVCNLFVYSHEEFDEASPEKDIADHYVLSNDGPLKDILRLRPDNFNEISDELHKEFQQFNPNNPFGEQ